MVSGSISLLLDELAAAAGCQFISDLHSSKYRDGVANALRAVDSSAYSSSAWREAALYICKKDLGDGAAAQLKQRLLSFLTGE